MTTPVDNANSPAESQQPAPDAQPETKPQNQATPVDMMIGGLRIFVEKLEKAEAEARAKAAERAHVSDDIPRFFTRRP